jgi:hypothetical protein
MPESFKNTPSRISSGIPKTLYGEKTPTKSAKAVDRVNERLLKKVEQIIGNKTTSNTDLDKIGKYLFQKKYLGTFAADKFPQCRCRSSSGIPKTLAQTPNPRGGCRGDCLGYCILNLDKTGMPGSHWVACINLGKTILVYDSFGRKTSNILKNVFRSNIKILDSNYDIEQEIHEDNCGARCITAILLYDEYGKDIFLKI